MKLERGTDFPPLSRLYCQLEKTLLLRGGVPMGSEDERNSCLLWVPLDLESSCGSDLCAHSPGRNSSRGKRRGQ